MKHLIGKVRTQEVDFMDDKLEVKLLSISDIEDMQKEISSKDDDMASLQTLSKICKHTVVGAEEMTDEEFKQFPLIEVTKLVEEIMKVNGLFATDDQGKT